MPNLNKNVAVSFLALGVFVFIVDAILIGMKVSKDKAFVAEPLKNRHVQVLIGSLAVIAVSGVVLWRINEDEAKAAGRSAPGIFAGIQSNVDSGIQDLKSSAQSLKTSIVGSS